jgi:peptidoglycan hydrolase-like protein with peptidoglycan-binding domain
MIYAQLETPFERGVVIRQIQELLRMRYSYPITVDGIYGKQSYAAVQHFQGTHFLRVDGIVGDNTWKALHNDKPIKPHKPSPKPKPVKPVPSNGWTDRKSVV